MTKDEAIKVLQREKDCVQQAIQKATDGYGYVSPDGLIRADDYVEACTKAISALRQQNVTDKDVGRNEPLTLDELLEMPCEPVYIVAGYVSWWDIVSFAGTEYLYLKVEGSLPFRDYGKNWAAYRQKPEEGTV